MIEKHNCVDIVKQAVTDWKSSPGKAKKIGLELNSFPSPVALIDLDSKEVLCVFGNRKRCDYLFLSCVSNKDICRVVPIEKKSKNPDINYAQKQLQGGADFAANYLVNCKDQFDLIPIVIADSYRKAKYRNFKKSKISMHGKKSIIKILKIGNIKDFWKQLIIKK